MHGALSPVPQRLLMVAVVTSTEVQAEFSFGSTSELQHENEIELHRFSH
jgi:hypothetical protein